MSGAKLLPAICVLLWCVLTAELAYAESGEQSPELIEAWADKTFMELADSGHISGAVVSVVKNGEILFAKGYGKGDVVKGTPADPYQTRARIGSTTKTFTATIIAQLMAEGKITSLDDPVNRYLQRYQLPDNAGVAITLKHLLTHTAGFEDKFFFIGTDRDVPIPVDADLYDTLRPNFVRPVDEKVVYSNFGVATLGLVIEDITGRPIDEAMEARIFEPLGMASTDLVISIEEPEGLAVPGQISSEGMAGPVAYTAINPAVAQTGSIVSTGHDMAQYMMAQMEGLPGYGRDLQDKLFTRLANNHPDVGGLGMVFFVDEWAGRKTVSHGGNWAGFHTWMTMVPEEKLGFYVTLFGDLSPSGIVDRFLAATLPALAPKPSPAMLSAYSLQGAFLQQTLGDKHPVLPTVDTDLSVYEGHYQLDRRPFHTVEAISSLVYFGADMMMVSAEKDGLYINGGGPFKPVGAGRFMIDAPGRPVMTFIKNTRTGDMVFSHNLGIYTATKVSVLSNTKWHAIGLHILLPLAVLGILVSLIFRGQSFVFPVTAIGVSSLVMVLAATAGLETGGSLVTGYYAGYLGRVAIFVIGFHALLLSSIWTAVVFYKAGTTQGRAVTGVFATFGIASIILLLPYHVLGWQIM